MWVLTFGGRLHTTPLSPSITSILDIGCGTGLWANAIAHAFPSAEVVATDLVPPQRKDDTAPNVRYIQHNADDADWSPLKEGQFEFIHARMITGGMHDWPGFRKKCFRHLKPGGALEIIDMSSPLRSEDPSYDSKDTSALVNFVHLAGESWERNGLDFGVSSKQVAGLEAVGFEEVEEETYRWPIGDWPEDEQEKRLGLLGRGNMDKFLTLSGRHVLTNRGFMSDEDAANTIDSAKMELSRAEERRYYYVMCVYSPFIRDLSFSLSANEISGKFTQRGNRCDPDAPFCHDASYIVHQSLCSYSSRARQIGAFDDSAMVLWPFYFFLHLCIATILVRSPKDKRAISEM